MAKISDFGNTWAKFFCRGETHAVHLARHPSPLHGKNRANWHRLQKIFSARESSSNVQNRAFWKPFSKILFKLLRTSINSHRSPLRILPAPPPVSGSILPAALLCKNRGKVETLFWNFSDTQHSSSSSEGAVFIQAALLSFAPPYLHGENQRFWKHLSKIFCQRETCAENLSYFLWLLSVICK